MSNEDNLNEELPDYVSGEIVKSGKQELRIFVTDADKYGTDVTIMSNFFDFYIEQLKSELSKNTAISVVENIPIVDLGIINEVVHHVEVMMGESMDTFPTSITFLITSKTNLTKAFIKSGSRNRSTGI